MKFNREVFYEVSGSVVVKKNQYKYTRKGGKSWGYKPKNVVDFIESALLQLKTQIRKYQKTPLPIYGDVAVYLWFDIMGKDKDLDGVVTTILDIIQTSEIIKNDSQVVILESIKTLECKEDLTKIYIKEL